MTNRTDLRVVPNHDEGWDDPFRAKRSGGGDDRMRDLDAEAAVLSNLLYDPSGIVEIQAILAPEHCASEAHRRIFEAILAVTAKGDVVNVVSVATELRENGRLAQAGGMVHLTEVVNAAPVLTTAALRTHANSVRRCWVRRECDALAARTRTRCATEAVDVEEILSNVRSEIDTLLLVASASEDTAHVNVVLRETITMMSTAISNGGLGARPTGFDRLDRLTAGLDNELTLIGGRPGTGKTSMATGAGVHIAKRGEGVVFVSLETPRDQFTMRMLCTEARVNVLKARSGMLTHTEWSKINAAAATIHALPIWIEDQAAGVASVTALWAKCRRIAGILAREGTKLGAVFVDYVQLLRAPRKNMERQEVVSENARALKAMAQDLRASVVGLAQLNRKAEHRTDKRPEIGDLRESGELEQCARTIHLIYREDTHKMKQPGYQPTGIVEVEIAKQNNGPQGLVRLGFEAETARFYNLPDGDQEDYDRGGA